MLRLAVTRAAFAVPVLLMVSIAAFCILRLAPGDPAVLQAGTEASPEAIAAIRADLRLDDPLPIQYGAWLGKVVTGDFGTSYTSHEPVTSIILQRLPVTAQLALLSLLIIVLIAVPLGIWSALHVDGLPDQTVRVGSLIGISVPNFVIGLLMVLLFSTWLPNVLPYQGFVRPGDGLADSLRHSLLPALAMAAPQIGLVARLTRSSMLEVLGRDYISAARAMGVRERVVVWKDALRNALLPVVTVLGTITGLLLGGSVVIEQVFSTAGLGRLLVESFSTRDYPVTIGVMMLIAFIFVVINILVDLLYGIINPRIRAGYGAVSR